MEPVHVTNRVDNIFGDVCSDKYKSFRFRLKEIDGHFILSLGHKELKELAHFTTKLIFSSVRDDSLYV